MASRDWKVSETGALEYDASVITGLAPREAVAQPSCRTARVRLSVRSQSVLPKKELWQRLDRLRAGLKPVPVSSPCGASWSPRCGSSGAIAPAERVTACCWRLA